MQHGPGSLNRIYRLVWNDSLGTFVAVAECARGRGKRSKVVGAVLVAGLLGSGLASAAGANGPPAATALPTGASVVAGQAAVRQSGARMDIEQTSTRAAINWLSFDIGAQAKVQVQMPNAQSVSLNRVIGADPSALFGQLSSNGQVVLVNPNGIVFGAGSRVDVGGLVASAMDIRTADFMAGRMLFNRGGSTAGVLNQGTLTAGPGGYIALLAPEVRNEGVVSAQFGTVALAAGEAVTMDLAGSTLLGVKVDPASVKALVDNRQLVQAEGGQVLMSAGAARHLLSQAVAGQAGADQLVESGGVVRLVSSSGQVSVGAGRIAVEGSTVDVAGQLSASGAQAGEVRVSADYLGQSGRIDANAAASTGGQVQLDASTLIQTASARISADGAAGGGQVRITGAGDQSRLYSSAEVTARGLEGEARGGRVVVTADNVQLRAAQIDASGAGAGGDVRIGGGFHGAETSVPNARDVGLNASTRVRADAGTAGDGGSVVVWSDATTTYAGQISARGGQTRGDGGSVEVSGKGTLAFAGQVDVSAPAGERGSLLLDPRNILIDDAASAVATLDLADPTPSATNGFGTIAEVLANGNVVITAPNADTGATTGTGAAYLFDTRTGALLSNLRGSNAGDHVGSAGIYALSTGHYLVLSPSYYTQSGKTYFSKITSDAGAYTDAQPRASAYALLSGSVSAGAITWQSATGSNGGASSLVSTANSLVGSSATDTRTTYNGKNVSTGSATVTANDELGKLASYDYVNWVDVPGTTTLHQLTDGNVAVANPYWYNGRGAVTWINGSTGALTDGSSGGAISATVSLVGSTGLRSQAVTSTDSNNHTVYVSSTTSALPYTATYNGNANTPMRLNAPGGAGDFVGQEVLALPGGGYAVASPMWTNGAQVYAGAVTHGAAGGTAGAVGTSNSLHGSHSFDFVGSGGLRATGSTSSHYLVQSPLWTATGNAAAGKYLENNPDGAVTWVDGGTGQPYAAGSTGAAISSSNSLIGTAGDALGAYSHATNSPGYYSYDYNTTTYVGTYPYAAGRVMPGATGLQALRNGHYLVVDNAGLGGRGSVTFGNGDSGVAGVVSSSNSLVGGTTDDMRSVTVTELAGSHYVVDNPTWTNPTGSKASAGAVTWGSGTSGVTGTVSASNSLVGTDAHEQVGSGGIRPVGTTGANGLATNYLVLSPLWGNRAGAADSTVAFGAVTWVDGTEGRAFGAAGTGAAVSSTNSLVGNSAGDYVGSYHRSDSRSTTGWNNGASQITSGWRADLTATVDVLDNGDYVVRSPSWGAGKGAITRATGSAGIAGTISAGNSLVGSTADVYATVSGSHTADGSTWADTTYYLTTTGDHVGLLGTALSGGQYVAISPSWGNGRGAITWVGSGASTGTVGSANSLVGSTQDVFSDANHSTLVSTGDRLGTVANSNWAVPVVSVRNSDSYTTTSTRSRAPYQLGLASDAGYWNGSATVVVGKNYSTTSVATTTFDSDGYGGLVSNFAFNATPVTFKLSNGNVLIGSPGWSNTGAAGAGAITWLNGSTGQFSDASSGGTLSATNSLVGSHTSDNLGYALPVGGAVELSNGHTVVVNPQWHDERGAVTWMSGTAGRTGTVSASNSLVGETPSGSITVTAPYNTTTGYTPYRYVNGLGWVSGWVDRGSDLKGDQVGRGGVIALADGNYVVASPFWQVDQASTVGLVPASRGAATWGNGSNGQFFDASAGGAISASNSLVGSAYGDAVSYAVWDFYGPSSPAAYSSYATLSISTTPSYAYLMPGITALSGGRYTVASPYWANGSATAAGAITFSAAGGLAGAVSTSNSLTGSHSGDHVGKGLATVDPYTWGYQWTPGVMTMTTGGATHYLVRSSDWTNTLDLASGGAGAGALTWVNGTTGHAFGESSSGAAVSSANSLVGNTAGDGVGLRTVALQRTVGGVTTNTGDLLSISNLAYCEPGVGAVTLIPGATGLAGPVSWRNSVIGLAPSSQGLNSSSWDPNYSVYTTDIRYTLLPSAVTAAEQVQYRPLVWVAPNATSGNNATRATVMTVVAEDTASPTTAAQVNTGGNANWESSLMAGNAAGFTGVGGDTTTGLLGFASNTGTDVVITPATLTGLLNAGTDVTLQASNDITVLKAVTTSASGQGGDLTLEAGRSVRIYAPITTDNGNFTAIANQTLAGGVMDADCSTCVSQIVMAPGTSVDTGTGTLTLSVLNSTDKTANAAGPLVVGDLAGRAITVSNQGLDATSRGMGIRFGADADLGTASTESLTLLARGTSALGGGLVLASDTALQGATTGQLLVGASDTSLAVTLGGSTGGLALTAAEIGTVIQQSSGFDQLHFGRTDQTGATTVAAMDFTGATMQRGGTTLDADLVLQGGSGGLSTTGSLTSGAATDRALELSVTDGTLALGASQTLTAATGNLVLSAHGSGSSVTQNASHVLNATRLLLDGTGSHNLATGNSNTIGTLAGDVGSAQVRTTSGHLTVGSVAGVAGFTADTSLLLRASGASSDLVLNEPVTLGSGVMTLVAGRHFTNNNPLDTGLDAGTGRYFVYSTNPSASLEAMTGYAKHYNQAYTGSAPAYASSGNWFLYSVAPTLTASVGAGATAVYGDSASAPGITTSGLIDGDTLATATTGSLATSLSSYTPSNAGFIPAGTYTLTLSGQGTLADRLGYTIAVTTGSSALTVQPKAITLSGLSADSKVYDGTTTTTVSGTATLQGSGATASDGRTMAGDTVSVSGTATGAFADRHAGTPAPPRA